MSEVKPVNGAAQEHELSPVPMTLEGSLILHQMVRINWPLWKALEPEQRAEHVAHAGALLQEMEAANSGSALFTLLGHKGDLMLVHFRASLEDLRAAELKWVGLKLWDFCEYTTSFLSVVELGLYEGSVRLYSALAAEGIAVDSEPWKQRVEAEMARLRETLAARLYPAIPARRYLCFYPMDKRRGESKNWYSLPIAYRQALMHDHGVIGRKYAGQVTQIISGAIGFDDWEWGVDLFADSPLVFKKLVYEMRFDPTSADYGAFGAFYLGTRVRAADLAAVLLS